MVLLMMNGYTADAAILENGSEVKKTRRWECGCPKRGCPRSQGLRACGAVGSIDHGSIETTSLGWLPRNAFQVCEGGRLLLGISRETVPSEISNPSFISSLGFEESSESRSVFFESPSGTNQRISVDLTMRSFLRVSTQRSGSEFLSFRAGKRPVCALGSRGHCATSVKVLSTETSKLVLNGGAGGRDFIGSSCCELVLVAG